MCAVMGPKTKAIFVNMNRNASDVDFFTLLSQAGFTVEVLHSLDNLGFSDMLAHQVSRNG